MVERSHHIGIPKQYAKIRRIIDNHGSTYISRKVLTEKLGEKIHPHAIRVLLDEKRILIYSCLNYKILRR